MATLDTATNPPHLLGAMRALIVDDDPDMRALCEVALTALGHDVSAHETGEAALRAYEQEDFPLVVLDWLMPGMDGLEVCRRIRAMPKGDRSVILVITARKEAGALEKVLAAGADDYVSKPIDIDLLNVRMGVAERTAENVLERKRAEAELHDTMLQLRRSRDDLRSILNELRIGTAITDAEGVVTFLSRPGQRMLGRSQDVAHGRAWTTVFPFDEEAFSAVRAMAERPRSERSKVPVNIARSDGQPLSLEIDIKDDPRDAQQKIFFLYDVSEVHALRRELDSRARYHDMVGKSKGMREVYELIRDVAPVDSTVLILGETGTGKELVARAIHHASRRKDGPLISINCAGLTESILTSQLFGHRRGAFTGAFEDHKGLFEAADTGTLFLDEIGDIPMAVQTNLLRVLQEREVTRVGDTKPRKIDVRVIAATHQSLNAGVADGSFRQDLLYRLRVVSIRLPPLRERREDIPLLTESLLAECRAVTGKNVEAISHEAMRVLVDFDWPGNVRELKSALEAAVIRCRTAVIHPEDLPTEVFDPSGQEPIVADAKDEKTTILNALRQAGGNRTAAAKLLGISRATFYRRLSVLEIDV